MNRDNRTHSSGENPDRRKQLGMVGEAYAKQHLEQHDYVILSQNWRCRTGELDLVAEKDGLVVIVEVRSRRETGRFGTPNESVDGRKRLKLRSLAGVYLQQHRLSRHPVRFDVACVYFDRKANFNRIEWIENAF